MSFVSLSFFDPVGLKAKLSGSGLESDRMLISFKVIHVQYTQTDTIRLVKPMVHWYEW